MTEFKVAALSRDIVGKKVRRLRREGKVPAVMYGPETAAMSLTVDHRELRQTLLKAGGTQIINIEVDGKEAYPTLARAVQRDPIRGDILHIDFYKVDLNQPIRAEVPVTISKEPKIVTGGAGIITHLMSTLEVEALPNNIPTHLEVDLSGLNIGDIFSAGSILLPDGVTSYADPDEPVFKIDYAASSPETEDEEADELLGLVEPSSEPEVIRSRKEEDEEE
jgi:large subunit ribosomal protein L25